MPRPPLTDSFGRVARDLRVSVTDRCNFRCVYCMPADGLDWMPKDEVLSFEEISRLVTIFVDLGIDTVRITGGEPLVRTGVEHLVGLLAAAHPTLDMSMTTNGFRLAELAPGLAAAGLDRVNVSLDSLQPGRFHEITRRDALDRVVEGLAAAAAAGLQPVKVNAVMVRGVNDDEAVDFATLARTHDYHVRFIEYMPLDAGHQWTQEHVVPSAELLAQIEARYPLVRADEDGPEPAVRHLFADGAPGSVGFISSVSEPFCGSCDRLRLTADGHLRTCLFALDEHDLKGPLRAGAADEELAAIIRSAVAGKWAGHRIGAADFVAPARSMSQIGG
ncbi:MAG: GTP 3',8-cyclase MoaA [Candidatus Dormibacteraeota bacterium]|nr:GTP 3',8-cyclase MoaA [Candidatus Dormibacteraeota bacterium]